MSGQALIEGLYRELLVASMIILIILLFNNLVLYRQKLHNSFSLMLICGTAMCVFELLWDIFDGHAALTPFIYLSVGAYAMAFLNFAVFFNHYFMECFGITMGKNGLVLFYGLPNAVILLLCLSTPWTHLFYQVNEAGLVIVMPLYSILLNGMIWIYDLSAMGMALRYMFGKDAKNENTTRIARSLVLFSFLIPAIYIIQLLTLGEPGDDYLALSLVVAISLCYLTANVNTYALLESRAKEEAVEADLRAAAKIQLSALPPDDARFTEHSRFSLEAFMAPARMVGGDFYDFFFLDEDHLYLAIADVSGKGIPAAMFMMHTKNILAEHARAGKTPAGILSDANTSIVVENREKMFLTVWVGILEISTGVLTTANAGHVWPALTEADGTFRLIRDKHGYLLGVRGGKQYENDVILLEPGSRLFVYTDGVTEAMNTAGMQFGKENMLTALNRASGLSPAGIIEEVRRSINAFTEGEAPFDDITMLCMEYKGQRGGAS